MASWIDCEKEKEERSPLEVVIVGIGQGNGYLVRGKDFGPE